MLDKFDRTEQEFRDAYNAHYGLVPPNPDRLELGVGNTEKPSP